MRVTNCLLKGQTGPNLHLQYSNTGCGVFNLGFFEPKVEKIYGFFFHSFCATNLDYGTKNNCKNQL